MEEARIEPVMVPGRNCWRISRAERASVIVDACDYYQVISKAMEKAERRIMVVGWDFDTRIALDPDDQGKGETLGHFFLRLARGLPDRDIDILKWNFGALKQLFRPAALYWLFRWWRTGAIDFRFDSAHPAGCSHHQKIVVIDDCLAACGGIDISTCRWDTSGHLAGDDRRTGPDGKPYMPWHDATMLVMGEVAADLGELGRERWKTATRRELQPIDGCSDDWPSSLPAMFRDVDIAIARTRAEYRGLAAVNEIETLCLDLIAAARRTVYIENQYFTSAKIAAAIGARLEEADPPEFVLVMPRRADGWLEQTAMDGARQKLVRALGKRDRRKRFRVYHPVNDAGENIYVHAKVMIVDDRLLRVGSANLNNRSLGLDSECDMVIDVGFEANRRAGPAIAALRHRLCAEHLDCSPEEFAAAEASAGSMLGAIEQLRSEGRSLHPLPMDELGPADEFIAANELLDPQSPDAMLEPIARRGLGRSWAAGRAMIERRLSRRR